MDPDTDRRLVELALARGLVSRAAVEGLARERDRLARGGRSVEALSALLYQRGLLDRAAVMALRREVSSPPGTASAAARSRIGKYQLEGELGRGGAGVVHRAMDLELKRPVALKTLAGIPDAEGVERFVREARAAARLQHPGIVAVYDAGVVDGIAFVALELVPGGSLDKRLALNGPLPPGDAARLVRDLAVAVQAAHAAGIIHRDLKPANVLLASDGRPRLTDFGLARDATTTQLTEPGAAAGTPGYMAPEQALGESAAIGPRTDVYGLGAVLFALLTGRAPFEGGTGLAILNKVLKDDVPSPSSLRLARKLAALPRDLEVICQKALERSPERRYASAAALAADLDAFLAGAPIQARAPGPLERLGRMARRRKGLVAALLLSLLAIPATFAARAWSQRREEDRRRLEAERHVLDARRLLDRIARGEVAVVGTDGALVRAAREFADDASVEVFLAELEAITRDMRRVTREALAVTATPTAEEASRGGETLAGLDGALARAEALGEEEGLVETDRRLVERALRRYARRNRAPDPDVLDDAHSLLARLHERKLGGRLRLVPFLMRAVAGRTGTPRAHLALVRHALSEEDEARAIDSIDALLGVVGEQASSMILRIVERHGGPFGAFALRIWHRHPDLLSGLKPDLIAEPRLRGDGWVLRRDIPKARESYRVALEHAPDDDRLLLRTAWLRTADAGSDTADLGPLLRALLERDPEVAEAWVLRALFASSEETRLVRGWLERTLELDRRSATAWEMLAKARAAANDTAGAVGALVNSAALAPLSPHARIYLVKWEVALGHYDDAVRHASDELHRAGDDPTVTELLALRGMALGIKGDWSAAIADFTLAIKWGFPDAQIYRERGKLHALAGDRTKAIADFEHFLRHANADVAPEIRAATEAELARLRAGG